MGKQIVGDLDVNGVITAHSIGGPASPATDGVIILNKYDLSSIISYGGVNSRIQLGDATTYDAGFSRRIVNASNEYLGVENGDKSVWERVPPGTTLTATLSDNSTTNGVWIIDRPIISNPNRGFEIIDEMNGVATTGSWGWYKSNSGAGSTWSYTLTDGVIGTYLGSTGTTATGSTKVSSGRASYTGIGALATDIFMVHGALSTSTDEFKSLFGFGDNISALPTNGIFFRYDRVTNGDFWEIVTMYGGTESSVVTSAQPSILSEGYQHLRIEVSSAGNRVDYWIDKAHVGNISTNIPATAGGNMMHIIKSAGTTNKVFYIDAVTLAAAYTGGRV